VPKTTEQIADGFRYSAYVAAVCMLVSGVLVLVAAAIEWKTDQWEEHRLGQREEAERSVRTTLGRMRVSILDITCADASDQRQVVCLVRTPEALVSFRCLGPVCEIRSSTPVGAL